MPKGLNEEQVRVNLQFTADTAQAKRQLRELQETLKQIVRDPSEGFSLDKKLAEASRYAAELQVHLQKGLNPNTGMLDFSRLNESIKQSGHSLSEYGAKLASMGPQGRQAFSQLASAVAQSEIPVKRMSTTLVKLGTVLRNTFRWQMSSTALHALIGGISSAYNYAKDLNESLNNIRIVTGQNIEQMERFAATANKAAKALSTSTLDYTNASLIYYQQGLSDKEVEARTNVTIKMANVTRQSAEQVSSQLTAIWNNYAEGSENLEYFADVITALGAATASSSSEISTGLEKFAAIGKTVGLSYEYATSALATVVATTRQSAEVVGNSFKTLFARIQGLKQGEEQDDGTDLNKYSQALLNVGINVKDASGQLKDMDVILEEMAEKWTLLSRNQQMALAQTVGGVRQYTQLIALMNNWGDMQKNLKIAQGSSGTLQEQQDIFAEGWEGAAKRVKAAWQEVYHALIDDKFFIKLLNFVEKAVKGIKNIIGALGGIPGVLTTIGTLLMTIYNKQIVNGIQNLTYSLKSLTASGRQSIINERQEQLNQMQNIAMNQPGLKNTESGRVWVENLTTQIRLQDQLTQKVDTISEHERFVYQSLMDQISARQKIAEEAAHAVDQAKNELEYEKELQRTRIANSAERMARLQGADVNSARKQAELDFDKAYNNYDQNRNNMAITTMDWDPSKFTNFNLLSSIPTTPSANDIEKMQILADNIMQTFGQALQRSENDEVKNIQIIMDELLSIDTKNLDQDAEAAAKNYIEKIKLFLQAHAQGFETTMAGKTAQELADTGAVVDQLDTKFNNINETGARVTNTFKDIGMMSQTASGYLQQASFQTMSLAQQMTNFAQIVSSMGMLFNQLNGVIDTWSNKDLNFGEKLFSSLTSVGMILPMILRSYQALAKTIEGTVAKETIYNAFLKMRQATQDKILAKQVASFTLEGKALTKQQAGVALRGIQNVLQGKALTKAQKELLVQLGILTTEDLQNKKLTARIILEKVINTVLTKRKILVAGILAALVLAGVAIKRYIDKQKEAAEKQAELDKEVMSNAKERVDKIHEEEEALNGLVTNLEKTLIAYKNGEATRDDIIDQTDELLKAYNIEGVALDLLTGNYDSLIQKVKEYQEEQRQTHIRELEGSYTGNYKSYSGFSFGIGNASTEEKNAFQAAWSKLTDEQKAVFAVTDVDNSMIGAKSYKQTDESKNTREGTIAAFEAMQIVRQAYIDAGLTNDNTFQEIEKYLKNTKEFYDSAKAITDEIISETDASTGYNSLKLYDQDTYYDKKYGSDKYFQLIPRVLKALTTDYGGDTEKARKYLLSQPGWSEALTKREAIKEKAKTTNVSEDELLEIYNSLSEGQKTVFFTIDISGKDKDGILRALDTGEAEVSMKINASYNKTLGEAKDHFKSNMSSTEIDTWAKKYGITWGEDSAMGISRDEFLAKSGRDRANWINSRYRETRDAEYNNALEYKKKHEEEIKNQPSREELSVKRQKLVEARKFADSEGEEWYDQEIAKIDAQINATNSLQQAEDSISRIESERIGEMADAIDKIHSLKIGDKISDEDLDKFKATFGDAVKDLFSYEGNGKWALVVDKVDFQNVAVEGFEALKEQQGGVLSEEQQRQVANYANSLTQLDEYTGNLITDEKVYQDRLKQLASQYPRLSKLTKEYGDAAAEVERTHGKDSKAVKALKEKQAELKQELKRSEWNTVLQDIEKYVEVLNKSTSSNDDIIKANKEIAKSFKAMFDIDISDWIEKKPEEYKEWITKLYTAEPDQINDILAQMTALAGLASEPLEAAWMENLGGYEHLKEVIESNPITVDAEGKADLTQLLKSLNITKENAAQVAAFLKAIGQTNLTIEGTGTIDLNTDEGMAAFMADGAIKVMASGKYPTFGTGADDLMTKIGGSGGGGSKKAEQHKKEEERYHVITEQLNDLSKAYDRVSKAKDRAFGPQRIKLIKDEIELLDKQIAAQEKMISEVEAWEKEDYNRLLYGRANGYEYTTKSGALVSKDIKGLDFYGINAVFDEYGNITNWDAIKQKVDEVYNAAIDEYNKNQNADFLAEVKGQYDGFTAIMKQWEETQNKKYEEQDKLTELRYNKQDKFEEKLTEQIEQRIQLEKNSLALIETQIRTLENHFFKSAEVYSLMGAQFSQSMTNAKNLWDDYNTWLSAKGEISDSAFEEKMQELFDKAGENIDDLLSQWDSLSSYYSEFLDNFDSRIKFESKLFDNLIDELEYYNDLLSLSGREKDYDSILKIIQAEQDVIKDRLAVNKQIRDEYQAEYNQIRQAYDTATSQAEKDFLQQSLEAVSDKLDEVNQQIRDDIKQDAELAQKEFTTALDKIYHAAELTLTDALGFDYLSQTMDLASKRAEEYLTKTNQIYETSQMLRDINRDIDKTDNTVAKTRLKNFSSEIEALQEKGELSHYELEDAKARYEILKAQIALEEAQNAKSTVRLQRDNEGNYGYVYTADRGKIDQARDNLAKAQNDRYNLALEHQQEYLRKFYDTEREANEALRALDEERKNDRTMTEEEYQRRRLEIITYYGNILQTYEDENTLALAVMNETAAEHINDSWTATFGDDENHGLIGKATQWAETTTAASAEVDDAFKELTDDLNAEVEPAYAQLDATIRNATVSSETLRSTLVDKLLPDMADVARGILDATLAWGDFADAVQEVINSMQQLQATTNSEAYNVDYSLEAAKAISNGDANSAYSFLSSRRKKIAAQGLEGQVVDTNRISALMTNYGSDSRARELINQVAAGLASFTDEELKKIGYNTGGYTGAWGSAGKLALLHEKELVLNAEDTKNMLAAVHLVRQISQAIDLQAQAAGIGSGLSTPGFGSIGNVLEQQVTIHAEFPNATNRSEIEAAFDNLVNRASQYANRK